MPAKIRLYDYLIDDDGNVNENSLTEMTCSLVEPAAVAAMQGERFQFMRQGYFVFDGEEDGKYIFNRIRYLVLNNNEDGSNPASAGMAYSAYMFGKVADNLEYTNDAATVFEDPENGNFFLKEDSRVYRDIIGFEKWDYSLIGRQK